jgi:competence protein ComEA
MYRKSRLLSSLLFLGLLATSLPATAEGKRQVNINTADAAKLALLPRVGPAVADRILDYRKQNGPFKAVEDLMHVRGIGEKTYALIKPYVALSGETSLTEKVHNSRSTSGKSGKSEGARH